MRFAYADPPYPKSQNVKARNNAIRYYGRDCQVNHEILVGTLESECPDGWALSTSTTALHDLLPLIPRPYRILSWVKRQSAMQQWPMYAWEPVILRRGREPRTSKDRTFPRDWVQADRDPHNRFTGAKPPAFCFWLFDCLGVEPGDDLWDVFPGSGVVGRAFETYKRQAQAHVDLPLFAESRL